MADFAFVPRVFALGAQPDAGELLARLARGGAHRGLVALERVIGFDPLQGPALPKQIEGLRGFHARLAARGGDDLPGPFHGGFLGALSFDLDVAGERALKRPRDPWGQPLVAGGLYVDFLVREEPSGKAWLVLGEEPGDARGSLAQRRARIEAELATPAPLREPRPLGPLVRHTSSAVHMRRIEELRERIAAGELYQANLAHRFTRAMSGTPVELYRRLRAVNPAPYMAYLEWEGGALLSASPELLLEFDGTLARTRPIKGTAPRGRTPEEDRAQAAALLASEKDRAELAMIVDLERNDLGRCARAASVRVEHFPRLESYASVHHLVADVVAEVAPGQDAFDLLAALFPGGSISGAPKLASLAAIAELEGEGRGFYTGSAGFVDTRGRAAFNVLIRTLLWRPGPVEGTGEVAFHVGGGITYGSRAEAEDGETLAKGLALARAVAAPGEEPYASLTVPGRT